MTPVPPVDHLRELYKLSLDEYRFEVTLNWDRTKYYLGFNSALITLATGLLKLSGPPSTNSYIICVFAIGAVASYLGMTTIRRGHEYYRRTIHKKTVLEELLGLSKPLDHTAANLSISTTAGQGDRQRILFQTQEYVTAPLRQHTITQTAVRLLQLMMIINLAGMLVTIYTLLQRQPMFAD